MKQEELMAGDLVHVIDACTGKRIPCSVTYIKDGRVGLDGEIDVVSLPIECVYPIPILPSILEKNGFEWRVGGVVLAGEDICLVQSGDAWRIKPNEKSDDTFCYIWSVHELQHALRLCGITKEIIV